VLFSFQRAPKASTGLRPLVQSQYKHGFKKKKQPKETKNKRQCPAGLGLQITGVVELRLGTHHSS